MIDAHELAPLDVNAQDRMQAGLRDPQVAVPVHGQAVGPPTGALDQLPAAVGEQPRDLQRRRGHFGHIHGPVGQTYRTLRGADPGRKEVRHHVASLSD